jgi:hypothetical protein
MEKATISGGFFKVLSLWGHAEQRSHQNLHIENTKEMPSDQRANPPLNSLSDIEHLAVFSKSVGLSQKCEVQSDSFGNRGISFTDDSISVRASSDRGIWFVEVADARASNLDWNDVALLQQMLCGQGEDIMPLRDQVGFISKNWDLIKEAYSSQNRQVTESRLAQMRAERVRRRIPELFE